ncbi:hypothetical protein EMCRGX_G015564 [Ephydatia muelleri]
MCNQLGQTAATCTNTRHTCHRINLCSAGNPGLGPQGCPDRIEVLSFLSSHFNKLTWRPSAGPISSIRCKAHSTAYAAASQGYIIEVPGLKDEVGTLIICNPAGHQFISDEKFAMIIALLNERCTELLITNEGNVGSVNFAVLAGWSLKTTEYITVKTIRNWCSVMTPEDHKALVAVISLQSTALLNEGCTTVSEMKINEKSSSPTRAPRMSKLSAYVE